MKPVCTIAYSEMTETKAWRWGLKVAAGAAHRSPAAPDKVQWPWGLAGRRYQQMPTRVLLCRPARVHVQYAGAQRRAPRIQGPWAHRRHHHAIAHAASPHTHSVGSFRRRSATWRRARARCVLLHEYLHLRGAAAGNACCVTRSNEPVRYGFMKTG
jgi:hypothetical protein